MLAETIWFGMTNVSGKVLSMFMRTWSPARWPRTTSGRGWESDLPDSVDGALRLGTGPREPYLEISAAPHPHELPASNGRYLYFDAAQRGIVSRVRAGRLV